MEMRYRVGTRTSPLALRQVEEVLNSLKKVYPDIKVEVVGINTYGDRDKLTPISQIEGTDFFTKEIDDTLLNKKIDLAVHSAKDLPDSLREGLVVAGMTECVDPNDVLVSKEGLKLDELPYGARIGTSSQRRKDALKKFRPDFQIIDIRGTIEERLRSLDYNELRITSHETRNLDAIIIAACALIRLGLEDRITQRIPFDILKPHPLQGRLAIVTRETDEETESLFSWCRSR